jgi:protocatechuate 3,4-dioxygenase beta subunit
MPTPTSPPPSPSSSAKPWLVLGAVVLAIAVLSWLSFGRERGEPDPQPSEAAALDSSAEPGGVRRPGGEASEPARSGASGKVVASTGEAIAGAVVTLAPLDPRDEDERGPQTTRSDTAGSWSFTDVEPGRYVLSATAPGFLAGLLPELELRPGADRSGLELRLEPGGHTLSGTVFDKTGGVIEGALVQLTPQSGVLRLRERESIFTLSDEEGRYTLQVPEGRHRVRASHPDYSSASLVLELGEGALSQDFTLTPSAVIEGVVLRERDGAPVPGAEVMWGRERMTILPDGGRVGIRDRGGKVLADADGRFRIRGLSPGLISLTARASALASGAPVQVPVGIAEHVEGVELRLAAAVDVDGRVVAAADGEGIAGARVELMSQLGPGAVAQTDEQGRFTAKGVLPGHYRVLTTAEGWTMPASGPQSLEVGGEPSSLLIELERGLSIRGRVEPPGAAEVAIELRPENVHASGGVMMLGAAHSTQTAAETGTFELTPIQPGRYTLDARTADGRGGSVEVEVGPEGAEGVVIELEQRAIVSGRVEDFDGRAIDDVSVRARKRETGRSLSVVINGRELTALSSPTSTEGRFELAGLSAGAWELEVVDGQSHPLTMDVGPRLELELGEGETKELVLRVEPRDGTIAGTVRDAEGQPVADAWVSAAFVPELTRPDAPKNDGEPGTHSKTRMVMITSDGADTPSTLPPQLTDQDGRFRFEGLRRGDYTISAEFDGGASKAVLEKVRPDAEVSLDLAPLGALEGRVLSNGEPADCIARLIGPSERSVRVRDGKFELDRLEPGAYTVEASAGDGSTSTRVEIEAGETAEVELALERFAKITGVIVDESGQGIAGAEILIGSGSGGRVEITRDGSEPQIFTKDDGSFEAHTAAGERVLLAREPGVPMPILVEPFVVEAGVDLDLGELRKRKMEGMHMEGGPGEGPDPGGP